MRRFYLGTFRPEYIEKAIAETRQGECHRCGLCCQLVYKCPFLGRDSQNLPYCRVYGDLRPANCHNYPFDVKDAEIDTCGYTFPEKEKLLAAGVTSSRAKKPQSTNLQSQQSQLEKLPLGSLTQEKYSTSASFQDKN